MSLALSLQWRHCADGVACAHSPMAPELPQNAPTTLRRFGAIR